MNDKALKEACEYIAKKTGDCPYDVLDVNLNCKGRCSQDLDIWLCWYKYFKEREEKEEQKWWTIKTILANY